MNRRLDYRIGIDGRPMAANLLKAGYDVTVWNRTPSRADGLVEQGAKRAATPRDVATASEVVFTIVSDPPRWNRSCGEGTVYRGLRRGSVLVDRVRFPPHWSARGGGRSSAGRRISGSAVTAGPGERKKASWCYGRRRKRNAQARRACAERDGRKKWFHLGRTARARR